MKKKYLVFLAVAIGSLSISAQSYSSLHDKVIKFYCYQRAGLKSGSSGNCNGMNEHTGDNYNGNPLDGGWYDAGDYIKFGMPLSYTVYCLLKGYDIFPSAYSASGGIPNILTEAKYATDYIMKAVIDENTVILDVGRAEEEHQTWGVVNGGGRDASKCLTCSGADIPAAYAACLALMSTLYREYDEKYADDCLAKAKVAFKFAKKKIDAGGDNNLYSRPQTKSGAALYDYYDPGDGKGPQRQINDKMVAAGVELYRATNDGDPIYKTWAKKSISEIYNVMSYSFIGPLASFEVWRQGLGSASSVFENVGFVEKMVKEEGLFKGVYQNSGWGTARDVGTASFVYALGYVTTSTESQRTAYLQRAKDHIAWLTGSNSMNQSFIIGEGNGPSNIHYRPKASGPPGGIVSGPAGENWANDGSAEYCEVAIDYNAGICGALAFLKAIDNPGSDIQVKAAFSATPDNEVDFTGGSVKFSAGFSKAIPWTLKISGAFGSKSFTGSDANVSATWDGSADEGFFLSGEQVAAKLEIEGNIVAYDILKARAISLYIAKAKKLAASDNDVLIDDFEDKDTANNVNGNWSPFGTETLFASKTKINFSEQDNSTAIQAICNVKTGENTTYAGIRTTFRADGSAGTIGPATTVVFDIKGSAETNINVELEQADIADGAYHSMTVPVTKVSNTYRLSIADFAQPEWKTADKPLDKNNISALRFTLYDSTGLINMFVDNVSIENFDPGASVISQEYQVPSSFKPMVINNTLRYTMPLFSIPAMECAVYNIAGRVVMRKTVHARAGANVTIPLGHLPAGMYTLIHSVDGKLVGSRMLFSLVN